MKNYFKLLNFEFNRLFKFYISLVIIVVLSQTIGTYFIAKGYLTSMEREINAQVGMTATEYVEAFGKFSFGNIASTSVFVFPIVLLTTALCLYLFYIWYRDWFGKNTFIYRLLMLPTTRMNLFFAKATTIILAFLGVAVLQIILLFIQQKMIKIIIPFDFRIDYPIQEMISFFDYEHILYPYMWVDLIINLIFVITAIFIIFTIILMERSFRLKGIVLGILYGFVSFSVFFGQAFALMFTGKNYLYPFENLFVQVLLSALVIGASLYISNYLLRKKITV